MSQFPCYIRKITILIFSIVMILSAPGQKLSALVFPDSILKIYQFPAYMIPRIDGIPDDWKTVPEEYRYGSGMLLDVENNRNGKVDPEDCNITVTVGWVQGLNRLYFLYEAYDNYWDFAETDLHNDMFEISVDGDLSGGEFIYGEADENGVREYLKGSHAQNYHINTPAVRKSAAMVWNCPAWLNKLPYLNCAYSYNFKHGDSGRLIMECWITPFDYISFHGQGYSAESVLKENRIIGLSWLIADWDGPGARHALPSLSHDVRQVHDASFLRPFRLMPIEENYRRPFEAKFSFALLDTEAGRVAFKDESRGRITSWKWDFGDGLYSTEQNPIHTFKQKGAYIVILYIEGPEGKTHYSALWEVLLK